MIAELLLVVTLAQTPKPTVTLVLGPRKEQEVVMEVDKARRLLEEADQIPEPIRKRFHAALVAALGTLPDSKPAHNFTPAEFERKRWQRQPAQGPRP